MNLTLISNDRKQTKESIQNFLDNIFFNEKNEIDSKIITDYNKFDQSLQDLEKSVKHDISMFSRMQRNDLNSENQIPKTPTHFNKENQNLNNRRSTRQSQVPMRMSATRGETALGIKDKTFQEIMIKDDELLKQKSLAVRQYLNDNLMPELTEVIVEVCKQKPGNPIEFAIEYLSQKINEKDE
jgi:hypothetical protein